MELSTHFAMESIPQQPNISAALDRLWVRFLPEIRERVDVLESAAKAFAASTLSLSQAEAAHTAAHKLAGVLGTFSLPSGTALARELEILYSLENGPDSALSERLAALAAQLRTTIENRNS
jgi:HPt (histidine-containing phosphotransfer) domain-containing protein